MTQPDVLILGTGHFGNPNNDVFNTEFDDVLSDRRQNEILDVVSAISNYQPTKIVVEAPKESQHLLNEQYQQYINEEFELRRNEIYQLGFRLALMVGHKKIYAVDWNEDVEGVPDPQQWAGENGSLSFEEVMKIGQIMESKSAELLANSTIKDYLLALSMEINEHNKKLYKLLKHVGTLDEPVGKLWVEKYWEYRNKRIYENINELVESKDERICVIYGFGHAYILNELFSKNNYKVSDIEDYLKP
ncbi:DUF5694 domain-containing protein [Piscibacillus sp. B03]|uniref:DUF5694 domain-containing protein n=1 Tax=Piscibacillus sp. B03 TaxID=3457430 RepID=UPI003FCD6E78